MARSILAVLFALFVVSAFAPSASAQSATDADAAEFRRIISSQINAFNADDGPAAYAFAAPLIQQIFPEPDLFMSMVRQGYQPVYRQKSYAFDRTAADGAGRPTQNVTIVDMNGKTWTAIYTMERQPDGSWRIAGCALIDPPGADV
jgi:hypothetical protein